MNKQIQRNSSTKKQIQTHTKEKERPPSENKNKQLKSNQFQGPLKNKPPSYLKTTITSRYKSVPKDKGYLNHLHPIIIVQIFKFVIDSIHSLYLYSTLNKKLYSSLSSNPQIIHHINLVNHNKDNLTIIQLQQQYLLNQVQKQSNFVYQASQLFQYGACKMNLANKLYAKLSINHHFTINNKPVLNTQQKTLGNNFQQNIFIKIDQINKQDMTLYDTFTIKVQSICLSLNLKQYLSQCFSYKDIQTKCIKLKAFNYYIDNNFLFVFFNNDSKKILYFIYQMSLQQLIQCLMKISNQYLSKMLNNKILKTVPKDLKVNKIKNNRLSYKTRYEFEEYIRNCMDFELFFKIHNNDKVLFDYSNTKIFPQEIDINCALFLIDINQKMDHYNNVQLNDQLGMQEKIEGLALLDLVLKNHDDYLLNQSSFITIQQQQQQLSFDVTQSFFINITHSDFTFQLQIHKEYNEKKFIVRELQIHLKNIY